MKISKQFILESIVYFDKIRMQQEMIDITKYRQVIEDKIYIYNNNNNKIRTYDYQILAYFEPIEKDDLYGKYIWKWAWTDDKIDNEYLRFSHIILNYGLSIDAFDVDIKKYLITSFFIINYDQIQIIIGLVLYILKQPIYLIAILLKKKTNNTFYILNNKVDN